LHYLPTTQWYTENPNTQHQHIHTQWYLSTARPYLRPVLRWSDRPSCWTTI